MFVHLLIRISSGNIITFYDHTWTWFHCLPTTLTFKWHTLLHTTKNERHDCHWCILCNKWFGCLGCYFTTKQQGRRCRYVASLGRVHHRRAKHDMVNWLEDGDWCWDFVLLHFVRIRVSLSVATFGMAWNYLLWIAYEVGYGGGFVQGTHNLNAIIY